jgi:hypothetical protein
MEWRLTRSDGRIAFEYTEIYGQYVISDPVQPDISFLQVLEEAFYHTSFSLSLILSRFHEIL